MHSLLNKILMLQNLLLSAPAGPMLLVCIGIPRKHLQKCQQIIFTGLWFHKQIAYMDLKKYTMGIVNLNQKVMKKN